MNRPNPHFDTVLLPAADDVPLLDEAFDIMELEEDGCSVLPHHLEFHDKPY